MIRLVLDEDIPPRAAEIAQGLGLDMERWNQCRAGDNIKNKIIGSLALGKTLGIKELPGVFVNNKQINLTADIDINKLLTTFTTKSE